MELVETTGVSVVVLRSSLDTVVESVETTAVVSSLSSTFVLKSFSLSSFITRSFFTLRTSFTLGIFPSAKSLLGLF